MEDTFLFHVFTVFSITYMEERSQTAMCFSELLGGLKCRATSLEALSERDPPLPRYYIPFRTCILWMNDYCVFAASVLKRKDGMLEKPERERGAWEQKSESICTGQRIASSS